MPNTYTYHNDRRITLTYDQVGVADGAPDWAKQQWNVTLRHGRRRMSFPFYGGGAASAPTADDAVECLVADSDALTMSFDEWCANYGYDADSRSALNTFNLCRKLGRKFAKLIDA